MQYPPREACHRCLSVRLRWQQQDGDGELLASTTLHHSNDLFFRERLPWRLGLVRLDAGPTVVAHLHGDVSATRRHACTSARASTAPGQAVLVALPPKEMPNMADDRQLREMTCDPKFRKVLVTDGKTAVGQAWSKALAAGADIVWVGHAEPWKKFPGFDESAALPQVTLVPLDVTDDALGDASWPARSAARSTS